MLVYGDWEETVDPAEWLDALSQGILRLSSLDVSIERHARLVGALVAAGQLLQGLADDGLPTSAVGAYVHELAECVVRSVDSNFTNLGELPKAPAPMQVTSVKLRVPEGYAFYAVYPEDYVLAARRLVLRGLPRVIGIRSIGASLGPVVAAALRAPPALTVRPYGSPFERQVDLPPQTIVPGAHYVIVDEGPGLSGSSFGAVADWLQDRDVPLEHIAFLPSHAGDLGPRASVAHRERWKSAQRVAARFHPWFLQKRFGPLENFAGGGPGQRLKFRAQRNGVDVLCKFAGLGRIGERKLAIARTLHSAGLVPEPIEFIHGFSIERWCKTAQALGPDDRPVEALGRYIGARALLLQAQAGAGASVEDLLTMCRRNITLALGEDVASLLDRYAPGPLSARVKRVCTDNKMQPHEWLRCADGRLLKTDAVDHHRGHDLIGCQGVEWDIVACSEEFRLARGEERDLVAAVGLAIDGELLEFYRIAFAAFRLGQAQLAGEKAEARRYGTLVSGLLHQNC